jgi:hypothetical protein
MALGSLSPFDRARATDAAASGVDVAAAEDAARGSLGAALDRSAQSYQQAATFDGATMLSQLEVLAKSLDADVSGPSAQVVEQARGDLAGSELRLKALATVPRAGVNSARAGSACRAGVAHRRSADGHRSAGHDATLLRCGRDECAGHGCART